MPSTPAEYLVDPEWGDEQTRLRMLERCLDPWTIAQLETLHPERGWACLELGAGGGSIARWLHRRTGDVVAADLDLRFLVPPEASSGFATATMDLRFDDFPAGSFDLIHCRYVLAHVGPRLAVLARMLEWLRPGGWLLVEEPDMFAAATSAHPGWAEWWHTMASLPAMDLTCGRSLAREVREAGGSDVDMAVHVTTARGGNDAAAFHRLSILASRQFLIPMGAMKAEDLDGLADALLDPDFVEPASAVVSVRARRRPQ